MFFDTIRQLNWACTLLKQSISRKIQWQIISLLKKEQNRQS